MATTLPPTIEAEFAHRWCRLGEPVSEIEAWLAAIGVKMDAGSYASRRSYHRPWSTHPAATAERKAIRLLDAPGRPPDNQVRKPTPEQRAACRVPQGGFKLGVRL